MLAGTVTRAPPLPTQLRRVNGRHPHIVLALKSFISDEGDMHLMLELAECDMFDMMQQQEGEHFSESHRFREWMLQCAHGACAVIECGNAGLRTTPPPESAPFPRSSQLLPPQGRVPQRCKTRELPHHTVQEVLQEQQLQ